MKTVLPRYQDGKEQKKAPVFTKKQKQVISSIYNAFRSAGLDDNSISGILGNALTESSLTEDSVSADKLYWGLWQNSVPIKDDIIKHYGDYSLANQAKYVRDWIEGAPHIKRNPNFTTYNGKYKKTGYATPAEAGKAFTRLYERPVIIDKKTGKVTGYNKEAERMANAELMAQYIADNFGIKETTLPDGNKQMTIDMSQYGFDKPNFESTWKPVQSIKTDYNLNNTTPQSISAWSGADAPNATPRLKDFQEVRQEDLNRGVNVYGDPISPFSLRLRLPSLTSLLQLNSPEEQAKSWFADALGISDIMPEMPSLFPRFADGKAPIHIKKENRGKFTALKKRTGHSASWFKAHGTPAQKKMATFALNAKKWKH